MAITNQCATIIGAGIVGVSCAIQLKSRGFDVTIIDRNEPCSGASGYNAGGIATAEVLPLASSNIFLKAPKWLMDAEGPLSIPPTYLFKITPWLFRFWRACAKQQMQESLKALSALMSISLPAVERLYTAAKIQNMLRCTGALYLYETDLEFRRAKADWKLRESVGIEFEYMSHTKLKNIEPSLGSHVIHAIHIPQWTMVDDPFTIGVALSQYARNVGTEFRRENVVQIKGADIKLQCGEKLTSDHIILAAGAWSHLLARDWGEKIPLETERGYNTTITNPEILINQELIFAEHGFVASPLSSGLRIGGGVELGGLNAPPNYKRASSMLLKAKRFLPELNIKGGKKWMGFRPSLPDSKPVIGRSLKNPRVIHAFGHGHLGFTQGPATAELVADILMDRKPAINLYPFRPDRF